MVVPATHHRVDGRLVLAGVRVVRVIARYDEVIHLLLEHLLSSGVLDVASGGAGAILAAHIVLVVLNSIFNAEVGKSIEFLPTRAILVSGAIQGLTLLRNYTSRVNYHSEVFLEVGRRKDFELKRLEVALLDQFGEHGLPTLGVVVEVILDFFRFKNVEILLSCTHFLLVGIDHIHRILRFQEIILNLLRCLQIIRCLYLIGLILHRITKGSSTNSHIAHIAIGIGRTPIARSILVL